MVLCIPGQGSPEWATAIAAGGVTIFVRCRMQSGGGQNGGAPPSLRREAQGHHAGRTVSKNPQPPPNIKHLLRANCLSYTPMTQAWRQPGGKSEGDKRTGNMPRNRSAIAALQKLEADREALDAKQRELEVQAARELGEIILGSGLESFSKKGLRKVAEELGKLGENAAIEKLTGRGSTRASNAAPGTQ